MDGSTLKGSGTALGEGGALVSLYRNARARLLFVIDAGKEVRDSGCSSM